MRLTNFLLVVVCSLTICTLVKSFPRDEERGRRRGPKKDRPKKHDSSSKNNKKDREDLTSFLMKYGYLPINTQVWSDDPGMVDQAILNFQKMAAIPMTGEMDEKTMEMVYKPRCGVPDMIGTAVFGSENGDNERNKFFSRSKRYTLSGLKWGHNELTYCFKNYSPDLSSSDSRDAIRRAFDLWSKASKLTFTEYGCGNGIDIQIEFAAGEHSDGPYGAFDGPGGTLAHAYFPETGDAHFDEDELWTVRTSSGTNLYIVAAHEFGHSLGLGHSDVFGALMYPYYQGYVENYQLPQDDTIAIQQIYGMPDVNRPDPTDPSRPTNPPPGPKTSKPEPDRPDTCTSDFDDILSTWDGETYALQGSYLWKINDYGVEPGYPQKINTVFKGIPNNINAAFTSKWTGRTYVFKGERFWRLYQNEAEAGYPKSIEGTGLPRSPDAAFMWGGNGKIYIMKGKYYYLWDEYTGRVVDGYPQKIKTHWKGIPNKVDGAFQWRNGKTYFFKGDDYWKFNDDLMKRDYGYPKSKAEYWLGCGTTTDGQKNKDTSRSKLLGPYRDEKNQS